MSLAADFAVPTNVWDGPRRFDNRDTRRNAMDATVSEWFEQLQHNAPTPMGDAQMDDWLWMLAKVPYASLRNSILLLAQCPSVTELGTYDAWTRHPKAEIRNVSALWVYDPIIDRLCPGCGRALYKHDVGDLQTTPDCACETPRTWDYGVAGTTTAALFARQQVSNPPVNDTTRSSFQIPEPYTTTDEYDIDLSEDAANAPTPLGIHQFESIRAARDAILAAASELGITIDFIERDKWDHIKPLQDSVRDCFSLNRRIEIVDRGTPAEQCARILNALTRLSIDQRPRDGSEYHRRSLEAEAAARGIARGIGHELTFELPPLTSRVDYDLWKADDATTLRRRCTRIRTSVASVLGAVSSTTIDASS
jgi:hypothetical protein